MRPPFSVNDGIRIQDEHLDLWSRVLQPSVFERLKTEAKSTNHKAKTGYDVTRGTDLDSLVHRYMRE